MVSMVNTPSEVLLMTEEMAVKKYQTPYVKHILLGVLGGIYIAIGGLLSFYVAYGMPSITQGSPALVKFIQGVLFPIGIILIILVGGELFTGNTAYLVTGARKGLIPWRFIPISWVTIWLANFLGAVFFSYFFVHLTGLLDMPPWRIGIYLKAIQKVSMPWLVVFLKGIAANWLVCLAVWLGLSSRSMIGRLVGLWLPVMAFVSIGFEHSIANMFYIPMGMMVGADISVGQMLWNNLVPATLGNIVGGALFVGCVYSFLYRSE